MGYLYQTNHNYFNKIDTEEKAYILGLLYADGCVKAPKSNRQGGFIITLQEEDGYILENFKNITNRPVTIQHPPRSIKNNWKKRAVMTVTSNEIYNDLIKLGCKVNKSKLGMSFPDISIDLYPHFIRGFLDGDGSIIHKKAKYNYIRKKTYKLKNENKLGYKNKLKIAFCSTDKNFLNKLVEIFKITPYFAEKIKTQITFILWIERKEEVNKCINYLYKDATIYLERKFDKIKEYNKAIKSEALSTLKERLETT